MVCARTRAGSSSRSRTGPSTTRTPCRRPTRSSHPISASYSSERRRPNPPSPLLGGRTSTRTDAVGDECHADGRRDRDRACAEAAAAAAVPRRHAGAWDLCVRRSRRRRAFGVPGLKVSEKGKQVMKLMGDHKVGTREEYRAARDELLEQEKELTRAGDELAKRRRELPWVPIEKDYEFDTDTGRRTLAQLFESDNLGPVPGLAAQCGTDPAGYLAEGPVFSSFAISDGVVYHTYSTGARGLEFLMGFYGILDRAPIGRNEGDLSEMWIRRHDEYASP